MFKPMAGYLAYEVHRLGKIALIEDETIQGVRKFVYRRKDSGEVRDIPLYKCMMGSSSKSIYFEQLIPAYGSPDHTHIMFTFLHMVVKKAVQYSKICKRNFTIITTDIGMMPEIMVDYGFRIALGRGPKSCTYVGVRNLKRGRNTSYEYDYLTRLKKNQASR